MKTGMRKIVGLIITVLFIEAAFAQETLELPTDICVLHLDRTNGNLVGLHWKNPDEEIIKESRLGENFRILLPMPDYEANYFFSTNQKVRFEKIKNGIVCHCDKLINECQMLNVSVDYKIESK
jgi:hypothetical protein